MEHLTIETLFLCHTLFQLQCENEHAEDDNAEYTRVLEEIERDECYPLKLEGDSQAQDFGIAGCPTSNVQTEGVRKVEMDPSHPLSSDCIVGEYASLPPTMPPREPVPEVGFEVVVRCILTQLSISSHFLEGADWWRKANAVCMKLHHILL